MTSHTATEILAASTSADLPQSHIRRPSTFLSLVPTTSASYPQQRPSPPASIVSPKIVAADVSAAATAAASPAPAVDSVPAVQAEELDASGLLKHRRSSSLASDESGSGKLRFLKLGPVHWGEGDGKGDWSEAGVAE